MQFIGKYKGHYSLVRKAVFVPPKHPSFNRRCKGKVATKSGQNFPVHSGQNFSVHGFHISKSRFDTLSDEVKIISIRPILDPL